MSGSGEQFMRTRLGWISLLFVFLVLQKCNFTCGDHEEYHAQCTFNGSLMPCMIALFSSHKPWKITERTVINFQKISKEIYWESLPTLCFNGEQQPTPGILFVKRGECAFDQKARVAEQQRLHALIIVNNDEKELFPMGSLEADYRSSLPVVLISQSTWTNISNQFLQVCTDTASTDGNSHRLLLAVTWTPKKKIEKMYNQISSTDNRANTNVQWNSSLVFTGFLILLVLFVTTGIVLMISSVGESECITGNLLVVIMLVIYLFVFVILRLGTIRLMDQGGEGLLANHNHRETDELIFEDLIRTTDPWNIFSYSLQGKEIMQKLSLAPENYDLPLFIHPPVFVYISIFLTRLCGLSLVIVPVVMQTVGIVGLFSICRELTVVILGDESRSPEFFATLGSLFNYSCLVLLCCPILWFISQKVWIDNALFMTTIITVAGHMCLTRWMTERSTVKNGVVMLFSGFICFGLSANCKITALALLPFLISWIGLRYFLLVRNISSGNSYTWKTYLTGCLWCCCCFCIGAFLSFLPWLLLYWNTTGRLLPSAWPSQSMMERYPFVRTAVNKPWHFYISSLCFLSPLHAGGVVFACYQLAGTFISKKDLNWSIFQKSFAYQESFRTYRLVCIAVGIWSGSFLFALSMLGCLGAGFQLRFMAPMLPGTALLVSLSMINPSNLVEQESRMSRLHHTLLLGTMSNMLFTLGLIVSAFHGFYYGLLYPPLYADLQFSLFDILKSIVTNPYEPIHSQEVSSKVIKFMKHFGLKLKD